MQISEKIKQLRKEYQHQQLIESDVAADPFTQFQRWFEQILAVDLLEPNAMILATASSTGQPSVRAVLLKDFTSKGPVFFTNYESRKGRELEANPQAALLFYWAELERQVRIEGRVEKLSRSESETYFHSRPRQSQLGALTSAQSRVIRNREVLSDRFNELEKSYQGKEISCPVYWGGYRLCPERYEFWQGRENRLHDRLLYTLTSPQHWDLTRLAP